MSERVIDFSLASREIQIHTNTPADWLSGDMGWLNEAFRKPKHH